MRYPGGKGKTYQHIINLMPPHEVYIETHLGGGAVMRHKKPASRTIGIDLDPNVIAAWDNRPHEDVELICCRAEEFLSTYRFAGNELLYVDPPYHPETRRRTRVYRKDYTIEEHEVLIDLLAAIPCKVILSGYANDLYNQRLSHWRKHCFFAKTHTGVREETLWLNFEPISELHDERYLGDDFREREAIKRRMQRIQHKFSRMNPIERRAFQKWLNDTYPSFDEVLNK